jgi:predicted dehydrogenase
MVSPQNHRAQSGDLAGPVLDMGPYPVNAARAVFGTEPISVSAVGSRHPEAGFGDFDDTVAVTLEFPQGRLAQFVVSYYGNALDTYTVVGTKGSAQMNPGYMYGKPLERSMIVGEEKTHERSKNTDHFGGELKYFSDCIMNDTLPEPGVEEGFADVRVLEAILQALKTGTAQKLSDFAYGSKIDTAAQLQTLAPQRSPELVHASNPGRGKDKIPLN